MTSMKISTNVYVCACTPEHMYTPMGREIFSFQLVLTEFYNSKKVNSKPNGFTNYEKHTFVWIWILCLLIPPCFCSCSFISLPGLLFLLVQLMNPTHLSRFGISSTFSVKPFWLTLSSSGLNVLHGASITLDPNFYDSTYQNTIIVNLCVFWPDPYSTHLWPPDS